MRTCLCRRSAARTPRGSQASERATNPTSPPTPGTPRSLPPRKSSAPSSASWSAAYARIAPQSEFGFLNEDIAVRPQELPTADALVNSMRTSGPAQRDDRGREGRTASEDNRGQKVGQGRHQPNERHRSRPSKLGLPAAIPCGSRCSARLNRHRSVAIDVFGSIRRYFRYQRGNHCIPFRVVHRCPSQTEHRCFLGRGLQRTMVN
jgi:hypothetical protein